MSTNRRRHLDDNYWMDANCDPFHVSSEVVAGGELFQKVISRSLKVELLHSEDIGYLLPLPVNLIVEDCIHHVTAICCRRITALAG